MPMRIARRLRASFDEPGATIDFYTATILFLIGLYFLHPGWLHFRYPRMAREMSVMFPLWIWGLSLVLLGAMTAAAAVYRSDRLLISCYIIGFGAWCTVGWIFFVGVAVPPIEGIMAPAVAALSVIRASQLPAEK